METMRFYGNCPFGIAVVHGGPGVPGEMAPVARELSTARGVLEPLQTATSLEGQMSELATSLRAMGDIPVVLIGWSWGAWVGYICAAEYPALVTKLILFGSGPFESRYATDIMDTCPVVAIHGDYDPHPAGGVIEPLSRTVKDFSFHLLASCGHQPRAERRARDRFFAILARELDT
ncbi:MAG: alpha/beta hydrolase [Dehalococcoidia bacterium]|nr:alpha/beta hydrolase [Dehalococcoidia bacterium]